MNNVVLASFTLIEEIVYYFNGPPDTYAEEVVRLQSLLHPQTWRALHGLDGRTIGSIVLHSWTLESLGRATPRKLKRMKGIGPKQVAEIRRVLAANGLSLLDE